MSNLEEIRAQLRTGEGSPPSSGGDSIPILLLLAVCGIAIGFAALSLMPRVHPVSLYSIVNTLRSFWR